MSKRRVALVGRGGAVGSAISARSLSELDNYSFRVISSRPASEFEHALGVEQATVDYASDNGWTGALSEVDVAILALSSQQGGLFDTSKRILDACAQAGVGMVILSEFTGNIGAKHLEELSVWNEKINVRKYAAELHSKGVLSWSSIANGSFLEWGMERGFSGFDKAIRTARFIDKGTKPFAVSSIATVADAAVAIVGKYFEGVRVNRAFFVADAFVSQAELFALIERNTDGQWHVERSKSSERMEVGLALYAAGQRSLGYVKIITSALLGELPRYDEVGNFRQEADKDMKELGLTPRKEAIEAAVKEYLRA